MVVLDLQIARALAAMKADPARRWTVAQLAKIAGMSRAAFARRFKRSMRAPPLRWLTEHRLKIARTRLVETELALAAVAQEIGYVSEFAFAKTFKRMFGVAPGNFRRMARHASSPFRAAA